MRPSTSAPPLTRFCLRAEAQSVFLNKAALGSTLTPAERTTLLSFPADKRRLDWLSGRLAAKRALAELLSRPPLELELVNEPSGRPACPAAPRVFVSISHCAHGGVGTVSTSGPVGVDWEPVKPMAPGVLELVTWDGERAGLSTPEDATRLWTRKEALLKLLGLGLGCDPRGARVFPAVSFDGAARERWLRLGSPTIAFHEELRDGAVLTTAFCS